MKGIISIFAMPQELEDLALTLDRLKRNSAYLDGTVDFGIDVTMCLSDELTDWSKSQLPKQYVEERTRELFEKYSDWCKYKTLTFELSNQILGCVSQRRKSLRNHPDADFFIWLDTDMFFKDITLHYLVDAFKMVKEDGYDMFVVTPQFVKQWDNTWDVIVNEKYKNAPVDYYKRADIEKESLLSLPEINILQIPTFKFAGGWVTLISKSLLDRIGVPESFGHYGLEDTFVMICSEIMKQRGEKVSQFVLHNLIAGEIHKSRTNTTIKKYIASINRKEEFRKIAEINFEKEVQKFIKD